MFHSTLLLMLAATAAAWAPDSNAKLYVKYGDDPSEHFLGNATATDHFRLLDKDDSTLLIGGRNTVYNLSMYNLGENVEQRLVWQSTGAHRELCQLKGKSADDCQNYPRVAARTSSGARLVCGTNAYKPLCRQYGSPVEAPDKYAEFDGAGKCPYDPEHNSSSIFANGALFTATAADFSGTDPLLYREPLRTERSDLGQLNDPAFVGAVTDERHVFFFYRETAVEYMNCGKAVYSRVARVCSNDKGGPHIFGDRWTSFLKARLNCSMPGDYPFYFDEIQSTSLLMEGPAGGLVYAVMTTPRNAIGGSAVCVFAMRDILDAFGGAFRAQETINANWLPVEEEKVPVPRPGGCVDDSRTLPVSSVNFVKTHALMDRAVPNYLARPLLVRVSLQYRFSAIAVHPKVQAMCGNRYDIIYVGTDDGRVIKAVNVASDDEFDGTVDEGGAPVRTVVVSEVQVLQPGTPIKQMHVALTAEKLIVISDEIVKSVPLYHCSNFTTCRDCVALQDPHCAWDSKTRSCTFVGNRQYPNPDRYLQHVGQPQPRAELCTRQAAPLPRPTRAPDGDASPPLRPRQHTHTTLTDIDNEIVIQLVETNLIADDNTLDKHEQDSLTVNKAEAMIYTAQALVTAVVASCVVTLLVGFIIGYLFSRRFRHPFLTDTSPFNEQHNHLNRLNPLETPLNANTTTYLPPRNKNVNIVANAPKQDNLHHELGKERTLDLKNSNESLDKDYTKCGTLQKVKKTYI